MFIIYGSLRCRKLGNGLSQEEILRYLKSRHPQRRDPTYDISTLTSEQSMSKTMSGVRHCFTFTMVKVTPRKRKS